MMSDARDTLLGLAEAADYFGVSRQVLSNWRRVGSVALPNGRRVLFPTPLVELRATPVWRESDLERLREALQAPAVIEQL
jgi:hypothetical protein